METTQTGLINDKECECIVLSTIINRPPLYFEAREFLDSSCFYDLKNQEIFESIEEIANNGEPISYISVHSLLQRKESMVTLDDIIDIMGYTAVIDIEYYSKRLKDLSCRRKLWELGNKLVQTGVSEVEDILDVQTQAKDELDNLLTSGVTTFTTLRDKCNDLTEIIRQNRLGENPMSGTSTGYAELDKRGGLTKGDLIVIAGESSHGKTSFALSLVRSAINQNNRIAFYSLEMTDLELATRLVSMQSGMSSLSLTTSSLYDEQVSKVQEAMNSLNLDNLFFDDSKTSNIDTIIASIRTMKLKFDIDGVVLDYMQILNVNMKSANVEQQMASVARRLKNLAMEMNIWIVALSQLNRNADYPYPTIHRLRDSGQIDEAADMVICTFIAEKASNPRHRCYPEPFEQVSSIGTAMIDIVKGRKVGTAKFIVGFRSECTEFYELQTTPMKENNGYDTPPSTGDCPF
jgi:replicative DNA helicase